MSSSHIYSHEATTAPSLEDPGATKDLQSEWRTVAMLLPLVTRRNRSKPVSIPSSGLSFPIHGILDKELCVEVRTLNAIALLLVRDAGEAVAVTARQGKESTWITIVGDHVEAPPPNSTATEAVREITAFNHSTSATSFTYDNTKNIKIQCGSSLWKKIDEIPFDSKFFHHKM